MEQTEKTGVGGSGAEQHCGILLQNRALCVCVCKNIFSMTTTRLSQIFMVLELYRHCFNAQFINRKHQCVTTVALQCHAVGKHVPSIASVTSNN